MLLGGSHYLLMDEISRILHNSSHEVTMFLQIADGLLPGTYILRITMNNFFLILTCNYCTNCTRAHLLHNHSEQSTNLPFFPQCSLYPRIPAALWSQGEDALDAIMLLLTQLQLILQT